MLGLLLLPEIKQMIAEGDFAGLRTALEELEPADVAEALADLPADNRAIVYRVLPRQQATDTFEFLPVDAQQELLHALGDSATAEILQNMRPDERTALLEELPAEVTTRLLLLLKGAELATAKQLLGYPEGSIGRRMTPNYISVAEHLTIDETIVHIRRQASKAETLNVLYVVDAKGAPLGEVQAGELLLAPEDGKIGQVMTRDVTSIMAHDDVELAIAQFRKEGGEALPVTDSTGRMVGIITSDDLLLVAEEAATEDIQKLGGSEALDEPYLRIGFWKMIRKRGGWLVVLFLGETLTTTAMGRYEQTMHTHTVLALFVPLIISSGGNSGSQAATLVIRAMALGEVRMRDWWRVLRREVATGLTLGALLGFIGLLRISLSTLFPNLAKAYGNHPFHLASVVMLALLGVVLWGTFIGSMLPFVLRKLKFDPASSSAPFVATLVDVVGLIIYFTIALKVMPGLKLD